MAPEGFQRMIGKPFVHARWHQAPVGPSKIDPTEDRRITHMDNAERNGIESVFGIGKRRYGFARIMAKLCCTSETVITLHFLIMNLDHKLRAWFYLLFNRLVYALLSLDFKAPALLD